MAGRPSVLDLAKEAAEWRLIGLLFSAPEGAWHEQIGSLGGEVGDSILRQAADAALEEASEDLYHSIFGPGGPASPREASYFDNIQLGQLISEICAHYDAFAYSRSQAEAPDHVAVEADFIAYLRLKEAYALAGDDFEKASVTGDAARHFLEDHVSRFAPALRDRFSEAGIDYLRLASEALASRCGKPLASRALLPVLQDPVEEPFECG